MHNAQGVFCFYCSLKKEIKIYRSEIRLTPNVEGGCVWGLVLLSISRLSSPSLTCLCIATAYSS